MDLLDLSSLLSDEERDIQGSVRGFLADRARPHIGQTLTGRAAYR